MRERNFLIVLFVIAIIVRVLLFLLFDDRMVVGSDQINYILLGRHLASGDFYGSLDTYWPPFYPVLIGLVTSLVGGIVLPAAIVSTIAGALAVPAIYYLVKQSYGSMEAKIASALSVLFPHLLNSTFSLGSENVYLLLVVGSLIFGWRALRQENPGDYLVTGSLLGLGYLTRPECFVYPAYFILISLGSRILFKTTWQRNMLPGLLLLLLGFAIFAAPYLIYLRAESGRWTISAKTEINTIINELPEPGTSGDSDSGELGIGSHLDSGKELAKYFLLNLVDINKLLPLLIPPVLWLFVGLGLFGSVWNGGRFFRESYLAGFVVATILGYAATVVQLRYFYILLPIFFGWIARGIVVFERWLSRSTQSWTNWQSYVKDTRLVAIGCIAVILLYLAPLNFWMRSDSVSIENRAYEERDAGLWLKQHGKPSPLVFSARMTPVFYAEGTQLPPRSTDIDEIIRDIRSRNVDYVITTSRGLRRNPYLKDLEGILLNSADFTRIYEDHRDPDHSISIFQYK